MSFLMEGSYSGTVWKSLSCPGGLKGIGHLHNNFQSNITILPEED